MKELVLLALGFAFIGSGLFLIRRARAMASTVDRQLNGWSDTWYDFTGRINMFGFGLAMFVLGCLSFFGAYLAWFTR